MATDLFSIVRTTWNRNIHKRHLDRASNNIIKLKAKIKEVKEKDASRLKEEYQRLLEGLRQTREAQATDVAMANPVLPQDILEEAIPGNIRQAEHFVSFLDRFNEYLKLRLAVLHVVNEPPNAFLQDLSEKVCGPLAEKLSPDLYARPKHFFFCIDIISILF